MTARDSLKRIARDVTACTLCPRLRAHCLEVARVRRAAYRDEVYWGLPVPAFGDGAARILIVGLAPGAHGANRTGRLFTGDRSGDFLFASLFRAGLCSSPQSRSRDDGLTLAGVFISAAARCAPPGNRPLPEEIRRCLPYLAREIRCLREVRVAVALGGIAFAALFETFAMLGIPRPSPRPRFGHGARVEAAEGRPLILASYHPSQQNTQTGRLTSRMLDEVLLTARRESAGGAGGGGPRGSGGPGAAGGSGGPGGPGKVRG